jgi:hypothetical protein
MEMDLKTIQTIGPRGIWIALVGSFFPICFGTLVAYLILQVDDFQTALATGCCFGPTSAGIAMNVLGPILQTHVGQLIVAAAIVDDMVALVVLSQLRALTTTDVTVGTILIPIISAIAWLLGGGAVALYVIPQHVTPALRSILRFCHDQLVLLLSSSSSSSCRSSRKKEDQSDGGTTNNNSNINDSMPKNQSTLENLQSDIVDPSGIVDSATVDYYKTTMNNNKDDDDDNNNKDLLLLDSIHWIILISFLMILL